MPNWCLNKLGVHGPRETLENWLAAQASERPQRSGDPAENAEAEPSLFTFSAQVPAPAGAAWPNWHYAHWGTKHDIQEGLPDIDWEDHDNLSMQFGSAWSPPLAWLKTVASLWPDLNFKLDYIEPGMDVCGFLTFEAGEITDEQEGPVTPKNLDDWDLNELREQAGD